MMTTALHKSRANILLNNLFVLRPSRCKSRCKSSHITKEAIKHPSDDKATVYVHWPYCARRCTYCNFNKYISKSVEHTRMADCLAKETKTLLQLSGVSMVTSIFFGGGTPSLALPSTVGKVIDTVKDHVTFTEGSEVTLEANPTHLETSKLRDFRHVGVNRLSVGMQALNTDDLKFLGRDHSVTEGLRCVEEAKCVFPGHVSVDLMFGRPRQTVEAWRKELQQVADMDVNHVSLYQLTVERGTQLFKWVDSGQVTVPDNEAMADMYTAAVEVLEAHGLERYEVSNFARQGSESKHNQAYWQGSQYVGVGPGAHGRFKPTTKHQSNNCPHSREARIQTLEPDNWMFEVEKFGHATRKIVSQSMKDRLEELLCLGLRTREGVTNGNWSKVIDIGYLQTIGSSKRCQQFVEDRLIEVDQRGIRATSNGLMILDTILPHLLYELGQLCDNEDIT